MHCLRFGTLFSGLWLAAYFNLANRRRCIPKEGIPTFPPVYGMVGVHFAKEGNRLAEYRLISTVLDPKSDGLVSFNVFLYTKYIEFHSHTNDMWRKMVIEAKYTKISKSTIPTPTTYFGC